MSEQIYSKRSVFLKVEVCEVVKLNFDFKHTDSKIELPTKQNRIIDDFLLPE